jgi:hypothetical protein
MTDTVHPRHRLVAVDARDGTRRPVQLTDAVHAGSLAVADEYLFAADGLAGQLVQLRFSR